MLYLIIGLLAFLLGVEIFSFIKYKRFVVVKGYMWMLILWVLLLLSIIIKK